MASFEGLLYAAILLLLCIFHVDVVRGQSTHPTEGNTELFKMNLSGTLAPEIGLLSELQNLNFIWNNLTGNIPKEIGNITTLKLLNLNGNHLSGSIPDEIGYLENLKRLQIDQNKISGPIPKSFANLMSMEHLHMNNNSLSGKIPSELSKMPGLLHLLLDNNDLSGPLPPKLAETHSLKILQADNNNFSGSSIPSAYNNIKTLIKMSLRNCSLQGGIPDLSGLPGLGYLDLSWNQLTGSIPTNRLASNITTIDLSHNFLNGTIPANFSGLPNIQFFDFQNNSLDTIPDAFEPPKAVVLLLFGNPVCDASNAARAARLCFRENAKRQLLAGWEITLPDVFGPYELLNFTYADEFPTVISSGLSKGALAGILVGTVTAAIAVSVASTIFIMRKRSIHRTVSRRSLLSRFSVKVDGVRCFTFEEMARASNAFDDSAEVGQGGYGKVYKGKLADGTAVAIKRAHEDSLQGSMEFCTEIELLSRLHHRNLVSLIGYCDEECEQMLVYEFMPNGTLRDHLSVISKRPLNFGQRLHIALGAAKGILYLHTEADPPIFHRDVKATNILLDSKFVAKVADFGLSKLAPVPDVEGTLPAHISTIVRGTPGYLDPEHILTHKLTEKSDVYSLGVVLLELLTGMKPIQFGKNIVREVKSAYRSGDIAGILDSRMSSCPLECATRFLLLALKCCQDETDARPYMAEIVRELDGIRSVLPEEDLFSVNSTITGSSVTLANSAPDSQAATTRELFNSLQASSSGQAYSGILSGTVSPR
ncbi:hypothetical protein ACQ4PT_071249 [Festuca glaucescens]